MTFSSCPRPWFVFLGTNLHRQESGATASADGSRGDGDNLLGPFVPIAGARPALLVDWPKALVDRAVFQGYTTSGRSAPSPWLLSVWALAPRFLLCLPLCLEKYWDDGAFPTCACPSVDDRLRRSPACQGPRLQPQGGLLMWRGRRAEHGADTSVHTSCVPPWRRCHRTP